MIKEQSAVSTNISTKTMTYNKERHKQLVIRSEYFKNQGKNLFRENPEEYFEFLDYTVEEQVFWTHRGEFFR
jgi:hypothetical protein